MRVGEVVMVSVLVGVLVCDGESVAELCDAECVSVCETEGVSVYDTECVPVCVIITH